MYYIACKTDVKLSREYVVESQICLKQKKKKTAYSYAA